MHEEDASELARAELAHWGESALNPLDALMWRTERPPADSWTGVVVMMLGGSPSWERVRRAHEWGIAVVPRFREKVVEPLVPTGPPVWTTDEDFDLDYHLRRARLPGPGSMEQLLEVAQRLGVTPLDRRRPPWTAIFVEGLTGGRSAYLLQSHHVLMDGAAATQLFSRVLDHMPDQGPSSVRPAGERPSISRLAAVRRGFEWQASGVRQLLRGGAAAVQKVKAGPVDSVRRGQSYVSSLPRVAAPPPRAASDLLRPGPRSKWRFGSLECDLTDLKSAAKSAGGTVNDAFVSAILGGLRIYHDRHGAALGDVPISMPVSVRRDDDPMGGNRFTGAFFSAPSGVAEAAERIQVMHERVERVRAEPALDFLGKVTPLMNLAPSGLVTAAIQALNSGATLTTSSWLGVPRPTYFAGAPFERMFVFGPLPGTSMCAALCTHEGVCCIGVNVDGDVFGDTDVLWDCLQKGLDEVLALAA
ncbi:wax ester/triacylglycerol synthase domain-containing protein [Nocardioides sp. NPDC101246]|uniref:wax ester/triacylglycerol synthase domain-containing protein n=1 Tax=Nocardioides sp. NPDC101246 TaxID=3364336 RepID=UPI0037FEA1A8